MKKQFGILLTKQQKVKSEICPGSVLGLSPAGLLACWCPCPPVGPLCALAFLVPGSLDLSSVLFGVLTRWFSFFSRGGFRAFRGTRWATVCFQVIPFGCTRVLWAILLRRSHLAIRFEPQFKAYPIRSVSDAATNMVCWLLDSSWLLRVV